MSENNQRAQWGSNLGFILSAAGSAVGLGNIWKFPGRAYNGGGGMFLIVYILIVAFIGMPVMISELALGRKTHKNVVGAYRMISKRWSIVGYLAFLSSFIILCYYAQVGGWVLEYFISYIVNSSAVYADPLNYFYGVLGANGFPLMGSVICPGIFMFFTMFVLTKGVSGGIEKFNKIAMPMLVVLLIILLIRSVTLPGAGEGIHYLLSFDTSKFNASMLLSALGQAFYSLSLGLAIMVTYGSYVSKKENIVKNAGYICFFDTFIAIIAGFIIIPAVFATGVEPGMGGGFAFASLAGVFEHMPAGTVFGIVFYLLLLFAALTSSVSLLEGGVAFVTEEFHTSRNKTVIVMGLIMFIIGIFYTLSQVHMPLKGVWIDAAQGLTFPSLGDCMEFITDRLTIPVGAFFSCIFVGWIWKAKEASKEVKSDGLYKFRLEKIWSFLIKFVCPAAILMIILYGMFFGISVS
ncbi:MAG: sodium-dependent transporter [Clostridia bacterium]|jgi:NSS family neurotransmitter:Na+ symporter|nr:sodium-dependent transporter [Clostridia bacterium]MCI2001084.1 sodium-dependent transporter [Clostridia bacterium]MCI2015790.1 sodium-dependent transporter [Clostridia bacterium]